MAHYQNQYSTQLGTDEYGNPIRQTDEYGNVISETGQQYADPLRHCDEFRDRDQYGNPIRRTDDYGRGIGEPTRRTVGTYEGYGSGGQHHGIFHHDKPHTESASTTGTTGVYTAGEQGGHHEKKRIMEKIKDKLPGAGGGHH